MRSSLTEVLSDLSGRYVVVIDGPDVPGPVPSAQLLSLADATLVVVTEGETSIRDARYTGDAMRALAGESVGAVLVQR
jgi:Mrp family chromosome partitioning ATPase